MSLKTNNTMLELIKHHTEYYEQNKIEQSVMLVEAALSMGRKE